MRRSLPAFEAKIAAAHDTRRIYGEVLTSKMNSLATSQSHARQPTQSAHAYATEVSLVVNRGFKVSLTVNRPWRPRRVLSLTLHGDLVLDVARRRERGGRDSAPLFYALHKGRLRRPPWIPRQRRASAMHGEVVREGSKLTAWPHQSVTKVWRTEGETG